MMSVMTQLSVMSVTERPPMVNRQPTPTPLIQTDTTDNSAHSDNRKAGRTVKVDAQLPKLDSPELLRNKGDRMTAESAAREAAKYRTRLREAEKIISDQQQLIQEQNLVITNVVAQGLFLDLDDFHQFIGMDKITTPAGRIDWEAFDREVIALLHRKPHLAVRQVSLGTPVPEEPAAPDTELHPSSGGHVNGQRPTFISSYLEGNNACTHHFPSEHTPAATG